MVTLKENYPNLYMCAYFPDYCVPCNYNCDIINLSLLGKTVFFLKSLTFFPITYGEKSARSTLLSFCKCGTISGQNSPYFVEYYWRIHNFIYSSVLFRVERIINSCYDSHIISCTHSSFLRFEHSHYYSPV